MTNSIQSTNYFRPDHYLKHPIVLASAEGTSLKDINGKEYLDFFAAMGTVSCGHNNPLINKAFIKQINTLWASSFFPSDTQLLAISRLNSVLPKGLEVVSLYSTGAESIEHAIRLAREATGRKRIITFKDHFHGKTHGTMFLAQFFPDCYGATPDSYRTVIQSDGRDDPDQIMEYLNAASGDDLAAVIFEPVIGYSGPRRLHEGFFRTVREFCDSNSAVMIVDEILTGFQRCKGWFLSCQEDSSPDIICFGKGLGNGYPVSGIAVIDSIAGFLKNSLPGSTFAGNSLACAIGLSVIDFMSQQNFSGKARQIEKLFLDYFSGPGYRSYGIKLDGIGALLSISFEDETFKEMEDIYLNILKDGVITSFTRTNLRIAPPLTIDIDEFQRGLEVIGKCIQSFWDLRSNKY